METYSQVLDDEGVLRFIERTIDQLRNTDDMKTYLLPMLNELAGAGSYQARFMNTNQSLLRELNNLLATMHPKPLSVEDLSPPQSLADLLSEEWNAFQA